MRKPLHEDLVRTREPLLVTLVPRHGEMEEFLRHQGYTGEILCLDAIINEIQQDDGVCSRCK